MLFSVLDIPIEKTLLFVPEITACLQITFLISQSPPYSNKDDNILSSP